MHSSSLLLILIGSLALASPAKTTITNGKAVYILSNAAQNAVISIPISPDGLLIGGSGTSTPTGGAGGIGLEITNGTSKPAPGPDVLFSQQSLTVAGKHLFAVNPGSSTFSMFAISDNDPTKLSLVGQPASVPGDFPVTVAASTRHNIACVGTTGTRAGISCASFSFKDGLGPMDTLRPFNLSQTTPPTGPLNSVSQVFFSDDHETLFSTVKGDPTQNKTGFLAAFPVVKNQCGAKVLSQQGTTSSPNGTVVLFGSCPIPQSTDLFVTDASFGAAVLSVNKEDMANVKGKGVIAGQKATCWSTISPATGTAFVADVATDRLVEMSLRNASVLSEIDLSANDDPGLIDLVAAGDFVYALSPGSGATQAAVTVVDAVGKKQVQHLQLESVGLSRTAQGMALLK
jgi:hypothetical protein